MTDQTQQDTRATKSSPSFLSESERRKLEHLTTRNDPRFSADAKNQVMLDRMKHWLRALFMRRDHGRWRISKTKGLAYITLGAAVLAFWNYYPRPHLETALDVPSLPIGASVAVQTPSKALLTRPAQPLEQRPKVRVTPPPRMPAPRIEQFDRTPVRSAPAPLSTPTYNPYADEPSTSNAMQPRVIVQPPPTFAGMGDGLEGSAVRPPTLAETQRPRNSIPRVAPTPTALVQRKPVWLLVPKPLIEHRADEAGKTLAVQAMLDKSLTPAPSDGLEPNTTVALVDTRAASNPLGQAGALVDVLGSSGRTNQGAESPAGVLFDTVKTPPAPVTPSSSAGDTPNQAALQTSDKLQPGTRVGAKLVAGVIAVTSQESAVVAQLETGALAFGKAILNASGRVQITLLEVIQDVDSSVANGLALGADGFPGLSVPPQEDSPDVVGKLWQAGLQGVSNYAQNAIQGATTTIVNGATTMTGPEANLGLSLLQSLAQAFLTPANQATVKYARLEPGMVFQVLFMPAK